MSTPGSGSGPFLSTVGERGLIERIRERLPAPPPELLVGVGDDAAVARTDRGALQILTTDALVEGVHFDWRFSTPADVGYKALAVNLSDIAAMGGTPRLALLSLVLPDRWPLAEFDALVGGILDIAGEHRVALAGGNISRSPGPLIVDVTVVGSARPRKVLTRGGGRPGDALFVTGAIGQASAGLEWLKAHGSGGSGEVPAPLRESVGRYRRPVPRSRIGSMLGRNRAASACIDLSDGLAEAVHQLADASGTGARIDADRLPIPEAVRSWLEGRGSDPVLASIAGGEDYELLFAVQSRRAGRLRGVIRQGRGVAVTRVGELTSGRSVMLVRNGDAAALPRGFTHF